MLRDEWVSPHVVSAILFNVDFNDHFHLSNVVRKIESLSGKYKILHSREMEPV